MKKKYRCICWIWCMILIQWSCQVKRFDYNQDRIINQEKDTKELALHADIFPRPLTLEEIIEITLNRNLDLLIQDEMLAIQKESETGEKLKLLPKLNLSYDYSLKDRYMKDIGRLQPEPRKAQKHEGTISWNIVDFGLSYFQAKRAKSQTELIRQKNIRLRQTLIQKITVAYWHAIVMQKAAEESVKLIEEISKNQADWQRQVESRIISELEGLDYQDQLARMKVRLKTFLKEARVKKSELAALMGLPPGTIIQFADVVFTNIQPLTMSLQELEEKALINRPELYVQDLEERISLDEKREAMIRMLPSIRLSYSKIESKNINYRNQNWNQIGLNAVYDLLALPQHLNNRRVAELNHKKIRRARLAQTLAILSQVHTAYHEYHEQYEHFLLAREMSDIARRKEEVTIKLKEHGEQTETEFFQKKIDAFMAKISTDLAFVDAKLALEDVNYALGIPLYFNNNVSIDSPEYEETRKIAFMYKEVETQRQEYLQQQEMKREQREKKQEEEEERERKRKEYNANKKAQKEAARLAKQQQREEQKNKKEKIRQEQRERRQQREEERKKKRKEYNLSRKAQKEAARLAKRQQKEEQKNKKQWRQNKPKRS